MNRLGIATAPKAASPTLSRRYHHHRKAPRQIQPIHLPLSPRLLPPKQSRSGPNLRSPPLAVSASTFQRFEPSIGYAGRSRPTYCATTVKYRSLSSATGTVELGSVGFSSKEAKAAADNSVNDAFESTTAPNSLGLNIEANDVGASHSVKSICI